MYFLLSYAYVENMAELRKPHREAHLALAQRYAQQGELILGGALVDPIDTGVLVFKVTDKTQVENFVQQDPYVAHGLVSQWTIREWAVVVGSAL